MEMQVDKSLLYPRYQELSESGLESPQHRRHQNSLTYTVSMETVHDFLRFQDECDLKNQGGISLAHNDIFIQGVKLNCPEFENGAISLRLITDEAEEIQNNYDDSSNRKKKTKQLIEENQHEEQEEIVACQVRDKILNFPSNRLLFKKKQSTLKINNIQYGGEEFQSDKEVYPKDNRTLIQPTQNRRIISNKVTLNNALKKKYLKNIQGSLNSAGKVQSQKNAYETSKKLETSTKKSSFKIINLFQNGSDFIEEENQSKFLGVNMESKSYLSKKGRIFSVLDPSEALSPQKRRSGSNSPYRNSTNPKTIHKNGKCEALIRQTSTTSKYKKQDTKIGMACPQNLKKNESKKQKSSHLGIIATKVSLTDRRMGVNTSQGVKNRKMKAISEVSQQFKPCSLKSFNKSQLAPEKKERDCPQLISMQASPNINIKPRQNIYHRKVLYMR